MRKVGTDKYTRVESEDEKEFNAHHEYKIGPAVQNGENEIIFTRIKFQKGPIKENGVNGIHNEDLLAIVVDRLSCLNDSEYKCRENSIAITKIEEALLWLGKRTRDRIERKVEGTRDV